MAADVLSLLSHDPAFPALRRATSSEYLLGLFRASIGEIRCIQSTEVLNYKPGRRCTLLYCLETLTGEQLKVVGKWYGLRYKARDQVERLSWLEQETRDGELSFPRLMGADPPRAVILQQHVGGTPLRDLTFADERRPFEKAGEWLSRLHALSPPPLLKLKTIDREIGKANRWAQVVASALPETQSAVSEVTEKLKMIAPQLEADAVVIHRDFYPANLLWDGQRLWGLDFDQMALGNRGVDQGAFVAQLEKLALKVGRPVEDVRHQTEAFLDAYRRSANIELEPALRFFRAYTLLRLAATEVERGRSGRSPLARALLQRVRTTLAS